MILSFARKSWQDGSIALHLLDPYNLDWALLVEQEGEEWVYFVVETQCGLFTDDLGDKVSVKIECGKTHFKALSVGETPARYDVARTMDDVLNESLL